MQTAQHYPPQMWASTATTSPCPLEVAEVKSRFSWRTLLVAPWHAVETMLWGVAAQDERYIEEVPVVLAEVEQARNQGLTVVR